MPGLDSMDVGKESLAGRWRFAMKMGQDRPWIERVGGLGAVQQRLDATRQTDIAAADGEVEPMNARPVARRDQPATRIVPQDPGSGASDSRGGSAPFPFVEPHQEGRDRESVPEPRSMGSDRRGWR